MVLRAAGEEVEVSILDPEVMFSVADPATKTALRAQGARRITIVGKRAARRTLAARIFFSPTP